MKLNSMRKLQSGFTIVELLIVIVVIGILAAITIVAYNGIQQRANNTQTVQAMSSWIKGLKLYKADNGRWPGGLVCLGEGYTYGPTGNDTSGTSQCRPNVLESTTFNTNVKPYLGGNLVTPSFTTAHNSDTDWRRGLTYFYGGGDGTWVYIEAAFAGALDECIAVDGIAGTRSVWNGNTRCLYRIGSTTDG